MIELLAARLRKRRAARDRQADLWRETGKRGHARAARRHSRAVRKLRALIRRRRRVSDISDRGLEFIASFEGFYPRPYNDPVGYATVGYGHLLGYRSVSAADSKGVWVEGQRRPGELTHAEALRLLRQDLARNYEPSVRALFEAGGPLEGKFEQTFYDALVSFAYNLGSGSLWRSEGFETVGRAVWSGDRRAVANALLLYDKAGGQALAGLTRRRRAERRLILTGNYSTEF